MLTEQYSFQRTIPSTSSRTQRKRDFVESTKGSLFFNKRLCSNNNMVLLKQSRLIFQQKPFNKITNTTIKTTLLICRIIKLSFSMCKFIERGMFCSDASVKKQLLYKIYFLKSLLSDIELFLCSVNKHRKKCGFFSR